MTRTDILATIAIGLLIALAIIYFNPAPGDGDRCINTITKTPIPHCVP